MSDQVKPFAAWLQEQRQGGLHSELSEQLQVLVAAVMEHQKRGALTLTIDVAPNRDGVTVFVTDEIKVKAPQPERPATIFYPDSSGNLSRRDPRQPELPLQAIPTPANPPAAEQPTGTEA